MKQRTSVVALVGTVIGIVVGTVVALAAPNAYGAGCGGNGTSVTVPAGGSVTCTVTKNGVTSTLNVQANGTITSRLDFPATTGPTFVQTIAHEGLSGAPGPDGGRVNNVPVGATSFVQTLSVIHCGGQIDVKGPIPGTAPANPLQHFDSSYRIQGPVVKTPRCLTGQNVPTTTTTTTTPPGSTVPPTTVPGGSVPPDVVTTTPQPALPATGNGYDPAAAVYLVIVLVMGGLVLRSIYLKTHRRA